MPYYITVQHRIDLNVVQLVAVCYAFDLVQDVIITKYYISAVRRLSPQPTAVQGGIFMPGRLGGLRLVATWHFSHGISSA